MLSDDRGFIVVIDVNLSTILKSNQGRVEEFEPILAFCTVKTVALVLWGAFNKFYDNSIVIGC